MMLNRARYYNPGSGRFLSEDPIGFDSGDYNNYRYVLNNSINYTDPSGMVVVCTRLPALAEDLFACHSTNTSRIDGIYNIPNAQCNMLCTFSEFEFGSLTGNQFPNEQDEPPSIPSGEDIEDDVSCREV